MTLSFTSNETLRSLSSLPILMQESGGDSVAIGMVSLFPHLHSSSPISLTVSVDVKQHEGGGLNFPIVLIYRACK